MEVTNRFKGLDLIDRVPEELWREVCDILQEVVMKTIPKKKKCKKAKWLSEEALQIVVKREAKGKGEKERYTHLNAEFQRIARKNKKAFLFLFAMFTEEGFPISPCNSLELYIQMGISFLFSFVFHFPFHSCL